jgi:hypothetical protein
MFTLEIMGNEITPLSVSCVKMTTEVSEEPDWDKDLEQLRKDLIKSIDKVQAELDSAIEYGKGKLQEERVARLRNQIRARAKEVHNLIDDYEGTGRKLLHDLDRKAEVTDDKEKAKSKHT